MALIPPFYLDAVVAIGVNPANARWVGTGFLYLQVLSREAESGTGHSYLVTNKHVLEAHSEIVIRANPRGDEPARLFNAVLVDSDAKPVWYGHPDPDVDVAILPINYQTLLDEGMQVAMFHSDLHCSDRSQLAATGSSEGDGCFILGFPMAMVGERRSTVIVRSGAIARIRDCIAGAADDFLVDAQIFPGNSGGPVILRPDAVAISGTQAPGKAQLIGIVRSYVPYQDIAISQQTNRPRVIFEENTGLASVHPVDCIHEAVLTHLAEIEAAQIEPAPEETVESPSEGAI